MTPSPPTSPLRFRRRRVVPEPGDADTHPRRRRVALTGATGFVGRSLLARLPRDDVQIAALARPRPGRDLSDGPQLRWIAGGLDRPQALAALVEGADTVIHCAGATKALRRRDFHRVNATATADLITAARRAGVAHLILVSSLAVTRPGVSDYAASKAAGEAEAIAGAHGMALTILRAPAVIGPGDQATRPLFSLLARGWLPIPGGAVRGARFSVIDVDDLAALLSDLALRPVPTLGPRVLAPYGHRALSWPDLAASAARLRGRPVRRVVLPGPLATLASGWADLAARLSGRAQVFSAGKLREMRAGDWIGDTPLDAPTPLDETMRRCLAPFLALGSAPVKTLPDGNRSPE